MFSNLLTDYCCCEIVFIMFTKYFVEYNTNKINNIMSKFETTIFRCFFLNMDEIYTYYTLSLN